MKIKPKFQTMTNDQIKISNVNYSKKYMNLILNIVFVNLKI